MGYAMGPLRTLKRTLKITIDNIVGGGVLMQFLASAVREVSWLYDEALSF